MKKLILLLGIAILLQIKSNAQSTNDILNLLTEGKLISKEKADSLRAEAAIKQQEADEKKKNFLVNAARQIQISGYTQVRYQRFEESGKIDGFDIRRTRLDIKGNFTPYWSFRVQTEFAVAPKLLDAYAEYKLNDCFNLTIGQAKIPFSFENLASSNKLESIDRSQVVEALTARSKDVIGNQNGRDIGLQIGGSFIKINDIYFVDYKAGIFNGAGINVSDNNFSKDFAGRIILHPIKGLGVGGGYYNGFGIFGTPATPKKRHRYGFELNYECQRFTYHSEYIKGFDGGIKKDGWYVQAGYFVLKQKLQTILKYDTYNSDLSKSKNQTTNYTIGLNYTINPFTRLQLAYTLRELQNKFNKNNFASLQFQIGF